MKNTRAILAPVNTRNIEAKRQPHDPGEQPEQELRGACLHPLDAEAHHQDEAERRQHDQIDQRRRRNLRIHPGLREHVGHDAGQREPGRHVVVDAEHILPQTDIDVGPDTNHRPHRPAGLRTQSH